MSTVRSSLPAFLPSSRTRTEGFTLVELIVGILLLAIALTFIARPILDGLGGSSHADSAAVVEGEISNTAAKLRRDLAAAGAPDRNPNDVRTVEQLHSDLMAAPGTVTSDDPARAGARIDVYDVLAATPTKLQFRADVDPAVGSECVTYDVSTGATLEITRTVTAGTTCGGAVLSKDDLVPRQPRVAGVTPAGTFAYDLICSRSARDGCGGSISRDCQPAATPSTSVAGVMRNAIVSVTLSASAVERRGNSYSASSEDVSAPLRSRESSFYRRALGCG